VFKKYFWLVAVVGLLVVGIGVYSEGGGDEDESTGSAEEKTYSLKELPEVLGEQTVMININTASQVQLETLWGVGESRAKKIIENRPYERVEELLDKKLLPANVYEEISGLVVVD
jgi:DNA uptake protein ComE-like DNA-binding protein